MKVVAVNGSARKDGNTAILLRLVLAELEAEGIETELIQLSGKPMHGCLACYKCFEKKNRLCAVTSDYMNEVIAAMDAADGILIGSPTYFANVSSETKALIDRAGLVSRANGDMFARKVGAAVVAERRAGGVNAFSAINLFFAAAQMIIPGSSYWNLGFGREIGQVEGDAEGRRTMVTLGGNMAWLMKKLAK